MLTYFTNSGVGLVILMFQKRKGKMYCNKKTGTNVDEMRQTAYLVVNPITV